MAHTLRSMWGKFSNTNEGHAHKDFTNERPGAQIIIKLLILPKFSINVIYKWIRFNL